MHKSLFSMTLILIATACGGPEPAPPLASPADVLLVNARVYSMSWDDPAGNGTLAANAPHDAAGWHPDAQAVAITAGKISYVGDGSGAEAYRGETTELIDLQGATLLPGLTDTHTHLFELGASLQRVNLIDIATEEEAVARIAERAKVVPKGEWIVGHGWDEGAWADRYPDKKQLSESVPDHPVFMRSLHSFAGWANQQALNRAGITATTDVPSGGEMFLNADGEPNGLFLNRAVDLIEGAVPELSTEQRIRELKAAMKKMASDGYSTVHDAGLDGAQMAVLERLEAASDLPIRIFAMLSVRDENLANDWLSRGPDTDNDSRLVTRSVKAFYDGALGSRGARLLEDYSDQPGHRGVSGNEYGFNEALTAALMRAGFQVGIHAIGDAGNRETLDFIEAVGVDDDKARGGRHRIEHAQVLHTDDIDRFSELGVIASMEPGHAVEDKTWAEQRLGPERVRTAYAWRALLEAGTSITFNSDNPGSDHSIFYGLHSAVTRTDKDHQPSGGWYNEQTVNIDEAVRAYTRWAAYTGFREQDTGTIEVGKWADLVAMDIDPFVTSEQNAEDLLMGNIVMTIVAGDVIFRAEQAR